jgi:hypothetical protein
MNNILIMAVDDRIVSEEQSEPVNLSVCRIYSENNCIGHTRSPAEAKTICKIDETLQWDRLPFFRKRMKKQRTIRPPVFRQKRNKK